MSTKSFSQIVSDMIAFIVGKMPRVDTRPGEVFRDVTIDPPAWEMAQLYSEAEVIRAAQSPVTARDADLIILARNVGLLRRGSVKATGMVTFFRYTDLTEDITISAGTVVTTQATGSTSPISFITLTTVTLPLIGASGYYNPDTNRYEISAPIQAVSGGAGGNVASSTIVIISNPVPGISGCTNSSASSGGLDQETIENLRTRVLAVMAGNNVNTPYGYYLRALSDPNVSGVLVVGAGDAGMLRQAAGAVDIYIRGVIPTLKEDQFTYYTLQPQYVLGSQPVLIGAGYPVTLVGSVTGSLVQGVDWQWAEDTGIYRGSLRSQTAIQWLHDLGADQTITANYYYNSLVSEVQALVVDSHYKGATANVLVFAARERFIDVSCGIKILSGYAFSDVQLRVAQALTTQLDAYLIGQTVEKADLIVIARQITGVSDVNTATFTLSVEDGEITPDSLGNIVIPPYSYATAGVMTVNQVT